MMTRQEILKTPEYWITQIQIELYNRVEQYMAQYDLNRSQFAEQLGVSKGYVSQLLNGDFDHKLSKLVELSMAVGYVPEITFRDINSVLQRDVNKAHIAKNWQNFSFSPFGTTQVTKFKQAINADGNAPTACSKIQGANAA